MKKVFVAAALVGLLVLAVPSGVSAAPSENASHVAKCATGMGGQEVAACAQAMEKGVSACAKGLDTCSMP